MLVIDEREMLDSQNANGEVARWLLPQRPGITLSTHTTSQQTELVHRKMLQVTETYTLRMKSKIK